MQTERDASGSGKASVPDNVRGDEDDGSDSSPMESSFSSGGKRYNLHLINEHIKMIKAGMTPEQIIDLFEQTKKEIKLDTRKEAQGRRNGEVPKGEFQNKISPGIYNMNDVPKPNHCSAFEEVIAGADIERPTIIRTKSLRTLQVTGGATTPHFLAIELASNKGKSLEENDENDENEKSSNSLVERLNFTLLSGKNADSDEKEDDKTDALSVMHRGRIKQTYSQTNFSLNPFPSSNADMENSLSLSSSSSIDVPRKPRNSSSRSPSPVVNIKKSSSSSVGIPLKQDVASRSISLTTHELPPSAVLHRYGTKSRKTRSSSSRSPSPIANIENSLLSSVDISSTQANTSRSPSPTSNHFPSSANIHRDSSRSPRPTSNRSTSPAADDFSSSAAGQAMARTASSRSPSPTSLEPPPVIQATLRRSPPPSPNHKNIPPLSPTRKSFSRSPSPTVTNRLSPLDGPALARGTLSRSPSPTSLELPPLVVKASHSRSRSPSPNLKNISAAVSPTRKSSSRSPSPTLAQGTLGRSSPRTSLEPLPPVAKTSPSRSRSPSPNLKSSSAVSPTRKSSGQSRSHSPALQKLSSTEEISDGDFSNSTTCESSLRSRSPSRSPSPTIKRIPPLSPIRTSGSRSRSPSPNIRDNSRSPMPDSKSLLTRQSVLPLPDNPLLTQTASGDSIGDSSYSHVRFTQTSSVVSPPDVYKVPQHKVPHYSSDGSTKVQSSSPPEGRYVVPITRRRKAPSQSSSLPPPPPPQAPSQALHSPRRKANRPIHQNHQDRLPSTTGRTPKRTTSPPLSSMPSNRLALSPNHQNMNPSSQGRTQARSPPPPQSHSPIPPNRQVLPPNHQNIIPSSRGRTQAHSPPPPQSHFPIPPNRQVLPLNHQNMNPSSRGRTQARSPPPPQSHSPIPANRQSMPPNHQNMISSSHEKPQLRQSLPADYQNMLPSPQSFSSDSSKTRSNDSSLPSPPAQTRGKTHLRSTSLSPKLQATLRKINLSSTPGLLSFPLPKGSRIPELHDPTKRKNATNTSSSGSSKSASKEKEKRKKSSEQVSKEKREIKSVFHERKQKADRKAWSLVSREY